MLMELCQYPFSAFDDGRDCFQRLANLLTATTESSRISVAILVHRSVEDMGLLGNPQPTYSFEADQIGNAMTAIARHVLVRQAIIFTVAPVVIRIQPTSC